MRLDAVPQILRPDDFSNVVNPTLRATSIMPNNPNWLRYDPDEDKSRHGAADEACCYEMQRKYGWKLIDIEETNANGLEVDCVFRGKTEFPKSFYDTEREDDDA